MHARSAMPGCAARTVPFPPARAFVASAHSPKLTSPIPRRNRLNGLQNMKRCSRSPMIAHTFTSADGPRCDALHMSSCETPQVQNPPNAGVNLRQGGAGGRAALTRT